VAGIDDHSGHCPGLLPDRGDEHRDDVLFDPRGDPGEEEFFYDVNPREQSGPRPGIAQNVAEVAYIAFRIEIHIPGMSRGAEGEGGGRSGLKVAFHEIFQRNIGKDVAVVHQQGLAFDKEIIDVFYPPARIEEHRFMAEYDGHAPPDTAGKHLCIGLGAMMGIDYESLDSRPPEMLHGIGDYRPPPQRQERFGAIVRKGPQACPQPGAQDEGGLDAPFRAE